MAGIAPGRLVFLDEGGVLTNLVRLYARSPKGQRAHGTAPCGDWTRLTVLGAPGLEGILGAMSIEEATSGAVFHAFLEQVLPPQLRQSKPDAVLVMDNLQAHKAKPVRELLDRSGFAYHYLPAYSPDFKPIEPGWAKMKSGLRKLAARTAETLHAAFGPALRAITPEDAHGFFRLLSGSVEVLPPSRVSGGRRGLVAVSPLCADCVERLGRSYSSAALTQQPFAYEPTSIAELLSVATRQSFSYPIAGQ
jgi:transposase